MEARGEVARYALVRKIASGGMATVYLGRARDPLGLERCSRGAEGFVAIKVCHPHLLDAPRRAALLDEARVAARIRHPNVVATLDTVPRDGTVWIVMEHVDGLTVAGLLRDGALPFAVAARIALDTLAGLGAVHAIDVVHRDVSPQNILVAREGTAKLADFGVFKGGERIAPSTETGDLKGKLGYVAPEVYRGEAITPRVDVYALGVVLWEMLAGRRLFEEDTHAAMMHRALRGWVPPLAGIRDDVPAQIDGVLARALAVDPADRFATAADFAGALGSLSTSSASAVRGAVGERVRRALRSSPPSVDHDSLTPNEYVTPVRPARVRSWRTSTAIALVSASLSVVLIAAFVAKRRPAPAPPRSAAAVLSLSEPAPTHAPTSVDVSTLPSASVTTTTKIAPKARPKPKRAEPAPSTRRFYDPEAP